MLELILVSTTSPVTFIESRQSIPIIEYCAHFSPPSTDSNKKVLVLLATFEYMVKGEALSKEIALESGMILNP
jgi:hypothetical protein